MKQFIAFNRQHWFTALTIILFMGVSVGVSSAALRLDNAMASHNAGNQIFEVTTTK